MVVNHLALLTDPPIKKMLLQKLKSHGVSYGLSEAGYDVRIKQDVTFIPGEMLNVQGRLVSGLGSVQVHDPNGHTEIMEGNFALASAIEEFEMPLHLVGIVHDKSTWARHGLSVFNTVIEPGWTGFLTLELVYHGRTKLHIPAGAGIAQVLFHRVSHPVGYTGKYQKQEDRPVGPIMQI
jgi:dCTP deaminase